MPSARRRTARLVVAVLVALLAAVLVTGAIASIDPSRWDLAALGAATYLLAGGLAFVEVGTPLGLVAPSELAVPFAGAAAAAGAVGLLPLVLVVWVCAALGDSVGYLTGRTAGHRLAARLRRRSARAAQSHDALLGHFARHGSATVLVGRFLPYARTATPLVAGSVRMPYRRFVLASALGSGVWSAAMCGLGYASYRSVDVMAERLSDGGLVAVALVVLVLVVGRARRRRAVPA